MNKLELLFKKSSQSVYLSEKVAKRQIKPNLYVQRQLVEGSICWSLYLHDMKIVQYFSDLGYMELNSGDWRTHTTKKYINQVLPDLYTLQQVSNNWFLISNWGNKTNSYPFRDHMIIDLAVGEIYYLHEATNSYRSYKEDPIPYHAAVR